jgi:hypothetical protein
MTLRQLVYTGLFLRYIEEKVEISSETSVNIHESTRHSTEDYNRHQHRCDNLKSCN